MVHSQAVEHGCSQILLRSHEDPCQKCMQLATGRPAVSAKILTAQVHGSLTSHEQCDAGRCVYSAARRPVVSAGILKAQDTEKLNTQ